MPLGKVLSLADYAGMHVRTEEEDLGRIKDNSIPSSRTRASWTSTRTS